MAEIAALVLAAGRASRYRAAGGAEPTKLVANYRGEAVVRWAVRGSRVPHPGRRRARAAGFAAAGADRQHRGRRGGGDGGHRLAGGSRLSRSRAIDAPACVVTFTAMT